MKIQPIVPAGLCVAAGLFIVGKAIFIEFDAFFFGVGVYFIGKGLFIHSLLSAVAEFRNSRQ